MSFIKYLLFIFNLVFAISGIGIITAGAVVLSDSVDFHHFASNDLIGPPIVLIVAGSVVFLIAFLGCFGAIRESYKLLIAFAGLLIVIFVLELAAGIAAAVYKGDFEESLKKTLHASMANYTNSQVEKYAWDNLQMKFKCCGIDQPTDWQIPPALYPRACCYEDHDDDHSKRPDNEVMKSDSYCSRSDYGRYVYSKGCYQKLKDKIERNTKALIGVGIGIAFIQVVGIVLACWLAYTIKNENERQK